MPLSMELTAAAGSIVSPLSPPNSLPVVHSPPPISLVGSAPSKSSSGSTGNSMITSSTGPVHTRARTTSSNSNATINATRYQIATSILQPPEPPLADIGQSAIRSPANGASLGEPSLSTIAAAAAAITNPSTPTSGRHTVPRMAESNEILISKLLSLSNTFTGSIRALCEQQNEKVLRFDDDMILELLTRWEQEAGKDEDEDLSEPDDASTTSLVTLGATNALERYQIIVGRIWEETNAILSYIRKIRNLVEFGRIQHYSDFEDDDSEEDVIEKDEVIKKRVGNNHDSEHDPEKLLSVMDFITEEPRPVKHLDPALMRKLKRKTRFKTITEKVRRSFSDFAKKSTNSILSVFPPLGDGTNEGFNSDSYSDGYYSEDWVGTECGSSLHGDEDSYNRTLSPPESPGHMSEKLYNRHRRLSSKDSSGIPEQYWPGSTRLGASDDAPPHPNTLPPKPDGKEKRHSLLFRRKSIQAPTYAGINISTPISEVSRPYSAYSSSSESQALSRKHYRVRPPRPPISLPPMPPSPTSKTFEQDSLGNSIGSGGLPSTQDIFKPKSLNRSSTYLATKSFSPSQSVPLVLYSPFTRHTSIRMTNDRNRYSVKMPEDYQPEDYHFMDTNTNSPFSSNKNIKLSGSFWRRRSYSDVLDSTWQNTLRDSLALSTGSSIDDSASTTSSPSTPVSRDFRSTLGLETTAPSESSSSVRVTSFEFMVPFFETNSNSNLSSSKQGNRPSSGSAVSQSGSERSIILGSNRRHSSPLTLAGERALAKALGRHSSVSSQKSQTNINLQQSQHFISERIPIQFASTVDENSRSKHNLVQRQSQDKSSAQDHIALSSNAAQGSVQFVEPDILNIPPRPKPTYKKLPQYNTRVNNNNDSHPHHTTENKSSVENYTESSFGHRELRTVESRIPVDPPRKPVVGPRFGDMRKAWEILNLDVKRLNQYSHLRAYAKGYTVQNNHWALSHPNAKRNPSSPRILHICENGIDVLVMEMFEGQLQVVAGLLEKLIERLADENEQDSEYVNCFLLSHSFFIDSEDLLDRLIARFHIQPRKGETLYFEKWQTIIQVKILCVLQRWVKIQYEDFELNASLLKTLKKFLEVDVRNGGFVMEAESIEKNVSIKSLSPIKNCSVIMEQGRFCLQRSRTRKISLSRCQNRMLGGNPSSPTSIITTGMMTSSKLEPVPASPVEQIVEHGPTPELATTSPILQLDGQDLARYLTLADMKAFRSITVFELMSGWWKRRQAAENKRKGAVGGGDGDDGVEAKSSSGLNIADMDGIEDGAVEAFIRRANMISYWVAHEIVSTAGSKTRKQLIKKFIEVAKICGRLNNLHTALFVVSALTSKPVRRLSSTWKLVSSRDMETLKELEGLMDPSGNMRAYRQAIAGAEAPDITFILDGNPTMITSKSDLPSHGPLQSMTPGTTTTNTPVSTPTAEIPLDVALASSDSTSMPKEAKDVPLVNFDKFRRLTQYVENAVDMAKSADYSFEHQLLRQARVFRPSSPSLYGDADSVNGGSSMHGGKSGNHNGYSHSGNSHSGPALDGSRGALDHISEIVERRLVKASGLYGVHQRVIQVEFINRAPGSKSSVGPSGLWKSGHVDGVGSNGGGHSFGSSAGGSGITEDSVIRAVQGEEDYLMGLSRMCEPVRY
ncbi:hypothetical protein FBU30_006337 [Linnemannia zychae]|nr:hypothetical protein FBU30_006337 [Linnemannia zychae]